MNRFFKLLLSVLYTVVCACSTGCTHHIATFERMGRVQQIDTLPGGRVLLHIKPLTGYKPFAGALKVGDTCRQLADIPGK